MDYVLARALSGTAIAMVLLLNFLGHPVGSLAAAAIAFFTLNPSFWIAIRIALDSFHSRIRKKKGSAEYKRWLIFRYERLAKIWRRASAKNSGNAMAIQRITAKMANDIAGRYATSILIDGCKTGFPSELPKIQD